MKAEVYKNEDGTEFEMTDIPAEMRDKAEEYHEKMLEQLAEVDDNLMEKYLNGQEISEEEIKAAIRKGTVELKLVAVTCGSSYKNKGVQMLVDAIVDYMPSPVDIPAIKGVNPDTEEDDERVASDDAPFSALAFKIMTDPYVGKLAFMRVYSGKAEAGSYVLNTSKGKTRTPGPHPADARQSPSGNHRSLHRGHCCRRRFKRYGHRRYPVRSGSSDYSRIDGIPGSGYLRRR